MSPRFTCAREGVRIRGGAARMAKPSPIVILPPSRQKEGSRNLDTFHSKLSLNTNMHDSCIITCRGESQWQDLREHIQHHRRWKACWPKKNNWSHVKQRFTVWTLFLLTVQILYNAQITNLKRGHVELFSHIGLQAGLVPSISLDYEGAEDQLWL